jgi:hypothetical protein
MLPLKNFACLRLSLASVICYLVFLKETGIDGETVEWRNFNALKHQRVP